MNKYVNNTIYIFMNIVAPYAGSFAYGSIKYKYYAPILIVQLIYSFQIHNILYGLVYVKNLEYIGYFLYFTMVMHSISLICNINTYHKRVILSLLLILLSFLSICYYGYFSENRVSVLVSSSLSPYMAGDILSYSKGRVDIGDLILGVDARGAKRFGVYIAGPKHKILIQKDRSVVVCKSEYDCYRYNAECVSIDNQTSQKILQKNEYLIKKEEI